ncbi:MAG: phosphoribosyltransferase [Planctomycetes bacterium]|nr:phosphoribosyltransferase [Planctomycetota bacterium]
MFEDRDDAGQRLASALGGYRDQDALILAIPRGGIEVGYQVARYLQAEFDIIMARKLPWPDNSEAGFGAIAEDSSIFIFPEVFAKLAKKKIDRIISEQHAELERRIGALRAGCPLPKIAGRTVILVDDGIATGSTMRVCVDMCRKAQAGLIVVAVPVAGRISAEEFRELADDVVIVEEIENFYAVAQGYLDWCDVSDREVIEIMHQWEYEKYQIMEY